jgi:hypothetical protein
MTQVWMYVVASSHDPNNVCCPVPFRVDEDLVFFGPCKKRIRERLRKEFLMNGVTHREIGSSTENVFIVGVNASNHQHIRKVVWAGKLSAVMTFAEAHGRLQQDRFRRLRVHPCSPLHVHPVRSKTGDLVGYTHVSSLHSMDREWVSDLVSPKAMPNVHVTGERLSLRRGTPYKTFDRDCCLLLENYFFAQGQGIEFDGEGLRILRRAQRNKPEIDAYAVFGRTASGQVNGLRGTYLPIRGDVADRFVSWLKDRSHKARREKADITYSGMRCVL